MTPSTLATGSGPVSDFEAWALESERRNYTHANGERRIKLETTEAVTEDGEEVRPAGVAWVPVDTPFDRQWSSAADWSAWRANAS